MELPLKPHQLLSHWVPGLVVLIFLLFLHYNWDYIKLTDVIAKQGSVVSVSLLLLAVAAFIIGEFIDAVRDLAEDCWNSKPKYKIDYERLHADGADSLVRESYWTYYVVCANLVIAALVCIAALLVKTLLSNVVDDAKILIWVAIAFVIVTVFFLNARSLRKELSEITQKRAKRKNTGQTK